jgi:alcohol dehydrogenase (cytochrome c)
MRIPLKIAITIGIFTGAAAISAFYFGTDRIVENKATWHAYSWRVQLSLRKAVGNVPELSWVELWTMMRRSGGFSLENMFINGSTLEAALANPYSQAEDLEAGQRIFRVHCVVCHGADATGSHAPPLNRPGFKNGDSDLRIYEVLRDGVRNTDMVPANLSFVERWQVIGYVRDLQLHFADRDSVKSQPNIPKVTSKQIEAYESKSGEWLTYSGSLSGWRYTPLTEITPANVSNLRVRWIRQFRSDDIKYESTPLVVGDTIFLTVPPASVIALDAKTGNEIWTYERRLPVNLPVCCGRVNRGLAILGNSLFFGSFDGYLVAINALDGKVIWQTQVAKSSDGYSMTGAPLIVKDSVVVGVAGGEFGIRGFLAAFDAASGQRRWQFDTIPGPGDFGHKTWESDAWKTGGGSTWVTGSYDPSLDLVYWGVANPSPPFSGDARPGDNLFTNSVVALNASSGKLAWHFQFTPHDEHDWDSAQTPILADVLINGLERKVICWPNRNGFYYVLDRVTGEFLTGVPFVEQNWAEGLTATGRPILSKESNVTKGGRLLKPGVLGGMNWQPAAFDPRKRLIFVPAVENASVFTKSDPDKMVRGNTGMLLGSGGSIAEPPILTVRALDVVTGARRWEFLSPHSELFDHSGLLATAGGVVFGASAGVLFALDSATGQELWSVPLGGHTLAAPISFTLDGQQVIAVLVGQALIVFGL